MKKNKILPTKELRTTTHKVEVRMDGEGESQGRTVSGYAAKFNEESELMGGWFVEIIEPGAFDDVLNDDVRALFNHDGNLILARSKSGTLTLEVDEVGLRYEFEAPNTSAGNDLIESLLRGDVDQSSFAFQVASGGSTWETIENDDNSTKEIRRISKIKKLYDVSPVTYPAYENTEVALRSYEQHQKTKNSEQPSPTPEAALEPYLAAQRMRSKNLM